MLQARGYAVKGPSSSLEPFDFERREPGPHEVLVSINYCGVCHSDIHQARNEWGGSIYPMVPGHEIVGKAAAIGDEVRKFKVGSQVGVGTFVDSCRRCGPCKAGEEQYCEEGATFTYNCYERDRKTLAQGGYSNYITVDEAYAFRIPKSIPPERAAPLMCAGTTTYSPLHHFGVKKNDRVAVVGLGGLGHMAVKIAKAMGAEVTVMSHTPDKREDALRLGAIDFVVTKDDAVFKQNTSRFDFIVDLVSAQHDFNAYLRTLRFEGTMILLGLPDPAPLKPSALEGQRRRLTGSNVGGTRDTQEMLDFCAKHGIAADVEVIPIQRIDEAFDRTVRSDVRYRFVIDIESLKGS
ncbi:MAG: NAD(P)-dependent alcohol dehydrogenase [Nitrososphaerales archaeon]